MSDEKKPVKVRLAEKYVRNLGGDVDYHDGADNSSDPRAVAYLAGFEKAKFLCIDFIARYADYRKDPPFSPDEEAEWLKKMKDRAPSEILRMIGEQI